MTSKKRVPKKRIKEVVEFLTEYGEQTTLETYSITSESLNRYKRWYKEYFGDFEIKTDLKKISELYTPSELRAIARGGRLMPGSDKTPIIDFGESRCRVGIMSDTHFGSIYFKEELYDAAVKEFHDQNVDFIVHSGDITEGMSNRPDQVYQLTHIGADQQKEYAVDLLGSTNKKIYCIDGNHDRWYIKNGGVKIVKDIAEKLNNVSFIGHNEGDISLDGKVVIKLFHGEDGASYATSYRPQKLTEMFTGGEKPHILISGHTHKQLYMFNRNIHAIEAGALSTQSSWMRAKKLPNHTGFWIIDFTIKKSGGVGSMTTTWYPFYM